MVIIGWISVPVQENAIMIHVIMLGNMVPNIIIIKRNAVIFVKFIFFLTMHWHASTSESVLTRSAS